MFFKWLVLGKGGVDNGVSWRTAQCSFSSHDTLERRASCLPSSSFLEMVIP